MFAQITPGTADYADLVEKLKSASIEVVYFGGYAPDAGIILRQARDAGCKIQFVGGDGLSGGTDDFGLVAGVAAEGVLATALPDLQNNPDVLAIQAKHDVAYTDWGLNDYAAVQVWAQAAEKARSVQLDAMMSILRSEKFTTLFGVVGFDEKGDITGIAPFVWYIRKNGAFVPTDIKTQ